MRNALTTMVGMAFLLAAGCSTNNGSDGGAGTNGTGNSGGDGGGIPAGGPCTAANQCQSNICMGHCCTSECNNGNTTCSIPTDCDDTGKCEYPDTSTSCGQTCASAIETDKFCDGAGGCSNPKTKMCDPFGCGLTSNMCNTSCTEDGGGCDITHFCNNGTCTPKVSPGLPCNGDSAECSSGQCAPNNVCCGHMCPSDPKNPECGVMACTGDAGGSCIYAPATTVCDKADATCVGTTLNAGLCDGTGNCAPASSQCPGNLTCNQLGSGCIAVGSCSNDPNCANGYYCIQNGSNKGSCAAQGGDGGCTANDQCLSGICGLSGTGNCCATACVTGDAMCQATKCDGTTSLCDYPKEGSACGGTLESCTADVQTNPTTCDGVGTCQNPAVPPTTNCAPYACNGTSACFTTCTDNTSCLAGDYCDPTAKSCCPALAAGITVDGVQGKDGACCGTALNPCQTITYAMTLVNAAKGTGTIISAAVAGNGGDWNVAGETYPIVLGWGVELLAPGVAFFDPNSVAPKGKAGTELFDIKQYSTSDTAFSASILGTAANPVIVGMNSKAISQSLDASAILVEGGNTLYLAAANVNGNSGATPPSTAITVQAGGTLYLGEDQTTKSLGTVTIGTIQNNLAGGNGIVCGAAGAAKACTITDVSPGTGLKSVVIENQMGYDIDAEDMASISLTADPAIGVAPPQPGFKACTTKNDANGLGMNLAAVLLHGSASVTFDKGTVQCIHAAGFRLISSASTTPPSLTLDSDTVQNTELGVYASAGTATVTNTIFEFNYNGVEQTDSGSTTGTVDLSGGGNTVICSSDVESVVAMQPTPGVDVLNTTSNNLAANSTAWDTLGPDQFSCNGALTNCTCPSMSCTNTAGDDSMDAVYTGTGTIVTTGHTQSQIPAAKNCN